MFQFRELDNNADGATSIIQITGKSKSGKSACAKQFCHETKDKNPNTLILWLSLSNNETLMDAYYKMAANYLNEDGRSKQSVINDFNAQLAARGNWLVVVDHIEDTKNLESMFPARGGRVILTTEKANPNYSTVTMEDLSPDDARTLIARLLKFKESKPEEINAIFQYCGGWPGAINDVCQFVNEYTTLKAGLAQLEENLQRPKEKKGSGVQLNLSVIEQLDSKLDQLDSDSKEVLKRIKYYNGLNIPIQLLSDNFNLQQDTVREKCLPILMKLHLIDVKKDEHQNEIISVSPLYQSALRANDQLSTNANVRDYLSAIERTFSYYHQELNPNSTSFRNHPTLWAHMDGLAAHYAHLANEIDDFYLNNSHIKAQRYNLLLLFGYQARHHYENKNLDEALKHTKVALNTLMKFDNVEIKALLLNSDHNWAKERFDFMQKVLREIVRSDDPKVNEMQKMEAKLLLKIVDDISERLMTIAKERDRQLRQEAEKMQRENNLQKLINSFNDGDKKSVGLSYKERVAKEYLEILSGAKSATELRSLQNIIMERDTILDKSAEFLGFSLGALKNSPMSVKASFQKSVEKLLSTMNSKPDETVTPDRPTPVLDEPKAETRIKSPKKGG